MRRLGVGSLAQSVSKVVSLGICAATASSVIGMDDGRAIVQLAVRLDVRLSISAHAAYHPLRGASGYIVGRREVNVWSIIVAIIANIISVVMMCIASVRPEHQARVSIFVCGPIMISHQSHPYHPHHHQDKSNEHSHAIVRQNE